MPIMTTIITTTSGTEYTFSNTAYQGATVRWEDRNGDPRIKGGRIKVWCNVKMRGARPRVGSPMFFQGECKYGMATSDAPLSWRTTEVVSIVRNGESLTSL